MPSGTSPPIQKIEPRPETEDTEQYSTLIEKATKEAISHITPTPCRVQWLIAQEAENKDDIHAGMIEIPNRSEESKYALYTRKRANTLSGNDGELEKTLEKYINDEIILSEWEKWSEKSNP